MTNKNKIMLKLSSFDNIVKLSLSDSPVYL